MATDKKKARELNASIVFIDETGLLMAPLVRRSWAPQGKTPILYQKTRSHEKVSMIAALTVPPVRKRIGLYFSLHAANINASRVVRFLRQLYRHIRGPIVLVWDRLQAHRAKKTVMFLNAKKKIISYFIPPYAPELNPVEYLWSNIKSNPLANRPCDTTDTLASVARYHGGRIRKKNKLLCSFLYASSLFLQNI